MKSILIISLLSVFMFACSSSQKKIMTDQTIKASEPVKTEAETATKEAMDKATAPAPDSIMRAECTLGKDSRVIAIDKNGDSGCLVTYTKNGDSKQVARSQVGQTYCSEVANRIKSNLTNAGFNCQ